MCHGWQVTVHLLITSARVASAPAANLDGSFARGSFQMPTLSFPFRVHPWWFARRGCFLVLHICVLSPSVRVSKRRFSCTTAQQARLHAYDMQLRVGHNRRAAQHACMTRREKGGWSVGRQLLDTGWVARVEANYDGWTARDRKDAGGDDGV